MLTILKRAYWRCYWRTKPWREGRSNPQAAIKFLRRRDLGLSFRQRCDLLRRFDRISRAVDTYHTQHEMLEVAAAILKFPRDGEGVVVEAGCYKGGSTAKFSLCAALAGRRLVVFDSFEGIPENDEVQHDFSHTKSVFVKGEYTGSLEEVKRNIAEYGDLSVCEFVKGWFSDTLPQFKDPIAVAYLDVDLVASTRDCLKHLHPLLMPGGTIFSQDGHLSNVIALLADDSFWRADVGVARPSMQGLGRRKLVAIAARGS